ERLADKLQVRIEHVAEEQFGAGIEDFNAHGKTTDENSSSDDTKNPSEDSHGECGWALISAVANTVRRFLFCRKTGSFAATFFSSERPLCGSVSRSSRSPLASLMRSI